MANQNIKNLVNLVNECGGAVEFHDIDLCISTLSEDFGTKTDSLYEVVNCRKSKFGVKNIPFSKLNLVDVLVKRIEKNLTKN